MSVARDFVCECGRAIELDQDMKDTSLPDCKECGAQMIRIYAVGGVNFNGSGFYKTDKHGN